jgi:hypothetical protein
MKNFPHSKPYFGLFWPLKLIKTLFTYFNHKIKPKPSLDGTLSPNIFFFSEGLYCTVLGLQRGLEIIDKLVIPVNNKSQDGFILNIEVKKELPVPKSDPIDDVIIERPYCALPNDKWK